MIGAVLLAGVSGCDDRPAPDEMAAEPGPTTRATEVLPDMERHLTDDGPPLVPESVVRQWSYRTVSNSRVAQPTWLTKRFGKANVRCQRIKAIREVPDMPRTFYRFHIELETYPSVEAAVSRIKGADDVPIEAEKTHFSLWKGFRLGATVVSVSTDVYKFEVEELPRIYRLVQEYFKEKDAQQACATDPPAADR